MESITNGNLSIKFVHKRFNIPNFFLLFFRYDLINFNLALKSGAFEEELFHLDFKWNIPTPTA